ncbi:MAG: PilZ domain-containing protein [Candidatus Omnitrophica bacterium]|nr:PilZ domain-containing protein [Candidatus Omnitrophota bacterium]
MIPAEYAGNERRKGQRALAHIPVRIAQEDGDIVTETLNISRSGAYCQVNDRVELMTKLKVQILLPAARKSQKRSKTIHCRGVVVRCEPSARNGRFDVAIFFNEIAQRDAESINDYVGSCFEQDHA